MIRILIFGATGMTGTAVLAAALTCIWFRISIFTRGNDIEIMRDMRKKPLARIVEGDMFNYDTVRDAMTDIDAVFFSTTYWDTMRVECEMEQGQNIVQAAMAAGVKHIIYVGTPYCHLYAPEKCKYLLGKEKVEALVVASGLPYTILHLGFYYENLLSVFRPHKVGRKSYALALPMGDVPLNCGSVLDFGRCIAKIMLRPTQNIFKTIRLCTAYHTVAELAKILDDHFEDLTFFDPKIPLSVYRAFDFRGSAELASMFAFYQSIQVQWSTDKTHEYFSGCVGFKEWVTDQDQYIVEAITEIKEEIFPKSLSIYLPKTEEVGYRHLTRKKSNKFRLSEPTGRIPRVILNAENFLQRYVFRYFSNLRKNSPEDSDLDEKQKGRRIPVSLQRAACSGKRTK